MSAPVHLVQGSDPMLRDRLVAEVVAGALGDDDRTLALEDHTLADPRRGRETAPSGGDEGDDDAPGSPEDVPAFRAAVRALTSPPFMTARRVVVLREAGNLRSTQVDELVAYLADPLDTSVLVLVAGGGRLSAKVTKAVASAGGETHKPAAESGRGGSRGPSAVEVELDRHLEAAGVRLRAPARARLVEHLGEDAGRVAELVDVLRAAHGPDATVDVDGVEPYLGAAGTASRFAITNAIEAGDVPGALEALDRLLHATAGTDTRGLHPLQVMASLQYYYRDLLRLDDPRITTPEEAQQALGAKSPYAARFRFDAARALGPEGLREAYRLLARADLDLRGASGVPDETVLEVLVARLAALASRGAGRRAGRATRSSPTTRSRRRA